MEILLHSYIDVLISVVLAAIMFGLGLSLTFSNFKQIIKFPRAFFVGLASQMIVLPALAFIILLFADIPGPFKVGIMILAACPGGTTSGFVTYLLKGNVALSIALTVINSFLTIFTIPFIVNFSLKYYLHQEVEIHLPFFESVMQIFLITLLPAMLGLFVRRTKPRFATAIQKYLKYILIALLAMVYTIKFFAGDQYGGSGITVDEVWTILPYALIFNILCFALSIVFGKLTKLKIRDAFTIALEVSLHNTTLALLIGGTFLQNQDMIKPALIYTMFSFWTAIIFGFITLKLYKKDFKE